MIQGCAMTRWHGRSGRKKSGGRLRMHRKHKRFERGRDFLPATIGKPKRKKIRTRGGNYKIRLFHDEYVNLVIPGTGRVERVKLLTVLENAANPHFVQRNIITKGAIVNTEKGKARIISRPGQHGVLNAILLESK